MQPTVIAVLVIVIGVLAYKLFARRKAIQPAATRGKYLTAAEVPDRLTEYFYAEYGGAQRRHDEEIDVCFRFAKIHQQYDQAAYPIDAVFTLHREAYINDPAVKDEFAKLLIRLEKAGLDFVALYGNSTSATTKPFRIFIEQGGCEHGEWEPPTQGERARGTHGGDRKSEAYRESRATATLTT